jgi:hypothetical protein
MVRGGDDDDDPREGLATGSELRWNPQENRSDREFSKRLDEKEAPEAPRPRDRTSDDERKS